MTSTGLQPLVELPMMNVRFAIFVAPGIGRDLDSGERPSVGCGGGVEGGKF